MTTPWLPRTIELAVSAISLASLTDIACWIPEISRNWRQVIPVSVCFLTEHSVLPESPALVLLSLASLRSTPNLAIALAHILQAVHLYTLASPVTFSQTILVLFHVALAQMRVVPGLWEQIAAVDCIRLLFHSQRPDVSLRWNRIQVSREKGWNAVRAALAAAWLPLFILSAIDALALIGSHHRRMVLGQVLGNANPQLGQVASLLILSHTCVLRRFVALQLRGIYSSLQTALNAAVPSYEKHGNERVREWIYIHSDLFIGRAASFVACIPRCIAEVYNLYLVACIIGWHVVIPVSVTLVHTIACKAIDWAVGHSDCSQNKNKAVLSRMSFLLDNLAELRRHGWGNTMGDAAESRQAQAKGRVIFNVLSYIIGFIGSAAAQITAAMAIISCFQMQAGITYIDVILLMPALDSLSDALSSAGAALDNATQLYAQLMQYCKLFGNQTSGITRISKRPDGMAVYLYGASFAWSAGKSPVLEDITLEICHGSMTAVIGRVGSGKSSLLAAMSGSLLRCSGVAAVSGNAFLVDSDPWILEGTFRDNVVMDQPFDDSRYWRVIESCALSNVVRNWPNGDMEIVDQYMLSTSQRSLLSLARAIYASADVLFIDDIFSYIDLRTRDKLLGGVLSTDGNRTLFVVSRSKPIVSLASRVVRVENQRVSVAKQTPKQWKTDCLFIPEYLDGSMSPSAGSTFSDSTALDATAAAGGRNKCHLPQPSLEWWHVAKYSALCGYLWMVIALAVQGVGLYTALYVDGYRKELILGTGSHQGVSRALYDYLVSDVIVSIIQQQLVACECWIRRGLWSEQAKEAIADKLMNAVRYSEIQIDSAFRDCACTLLTKGCYVLSTELPEQLSQRAMLILRSAYITVQILYALPVLGLFAVPLVISYIGMQLWWKATVAKRGLVSDHAGVADDLEDQNETSSPFCSVTMSSVDAQRGSIVGQAESKRDDCIAFVESAIGDIFAAIANTGWLLWPFLSQRLTGSGHFTPADVDISIRLSELISLLSTERKPLWPLLSVLPKYFAFTSRTEPPIGASSEELPLVAGGKIVLECRNIGLQFSGCSEPLCSNISFTLRTGEQLAVIGHNGQGKSMLFRSLFRLQSPGSALGSVAINGVEMSTIADSEIACLAEFVTADSVIFDASLRKNLDPLGSFTDAELSSVMQRARIPEIMPQMTLDTQVACPSTCQKQIISLCRAVLSKRPVVVFDQLTAGMDALTQKAVHAVVVGEFADRAVINITNQPSEVMSNSYVVAVH